jgi:hypothetical protein
VACEPRHRSWFTDAADALYRAHKVARLAADPPRSEKYGEPGGWADFNYYRLHGLPQIYYSNYAGAALERLRREHPRRAHFGSVVGVSLAGPARMRFRPHPPLEGHRKTAFALDLEPRSLYCMQGSALWDWQHAVSVTKTLRYSITFRTRRGQAHAPRTSARAADKRTRRGR